MFNFNLPTAPGRAIVAGVIGCACLMALHWLESLTQKVSAILLLRRMLHPIVVGVIAGLCILLLLFPSYDINPFIYFRF
jgi:phosphate/sulfate permease